jgi:hypothetical protein
VVPTFDAPRVAPAERLLPLRERPPAAVRPVLRPPVERLAVARLAGFFAALRAVERAAGFLAADFAVEREAVDLFAVLAVDFFAAAARPAGFFAALRAVERAAGFLAVERFAVDADFRAVDLPPVDLRPADFALDLAVAFLVPEDFEDLPADLPLDALLPAAAISRSFLKREEMMQ